MTAIPILIFTVLDALNYAGNLERYAEKHQRDARFGFCHGSIMDRELVDSLVSKGNIVIHFAAESHVTRYIFDNTNFFASNVIGT